MTKEQVIEQIANNNLHYLELCKKRDDYTPAMVEPELTNANLSIVISTKPCPECIVFETRTSIYELCYKDKVYTLTKKSIKDGCDSLVDAGRTFTGNKVELLSNCLELGNMHTSPVKEPEKLQRWLDYMGTGSVPITLESLIEEALKGAK